MRNIYCLEIQVIEGVVEVAGLAVLCGLLTELLVRLLTVATVLTLTALGTRTTLTAVLTVATLGTRTTLTTLRAVATLTTGRTLYIALGLLDEHAV